MPRPADLPNYAAPPLTEVVLGVQFASIQGYSTVDAGAIWSLFRSEFPFVQEQPLLLPQFETFGGGQSSEMQIQFGPMAGPTRLWFANEQGGNLLQFQPDRLLLNWRHNGSDAYPHYEGIAAVFRDSLSKLENHILASKFHRLDINQIEISYVNIITVENVSDLKKWVNIVPAFTSQIETVNVNFTQVLRSEDQKPIARMHHNVRSMVSIDGRNNAFQFDLTYRGKPALPGIDGALEMLGIGRTAIVNSFTEFTTIEAHDAWKRTK
jgi:uncharacterized protein (TIGR04255 family)